MGLCDFTVYSVIQRNAEIHRNRVALICGDERVTFQQLREQVDRVACGLVNAGVEQGDRIGVVAENSLEFVYLYGAASRIGAVVLPINWRLKPDEVEFIISDASPKLMFVGSDFQDLVTPLIGRSIFVRNTYSMGKACGEFATFDTLVQNDGKFPDVDVHSDDPYVILYTAAVAGRPRGAVLSHAGLLISGLQIVARWNLTEQDCNLGILPLFHVVGLGFWLMVMQAGGTTIILPRFDPDPALKHIQDDRVTLFVEFPPILSTLLDRNQELNCDLSSLRVVGGLEHPDTVKRFARETTASFWTAYGQSETSGLVTLAPYFERPGSAGLPCLMTQVKIMDDQGNLLEAGAIGEIVIRGPVVFNGYWNLGKNNEYTFRFGWHHTGDMGRLDEDGYLYCSGRMPEKELIKPGGENVYPAEVEKVILEHPLVEEVSVIGVSDEQWGEAIRAVCVVKKGGYIEASELIEFVASRITRYKKPKYVVFVPELPKTADGSINRTKVKAEHGFGALIIPIRFQNGKIGGTFFV